MKKPRTVGHTQTWQFSLNRDNLLEVEVITLFEFPVVITDMDDFLFEFPGLTCIFFVNAC